MRPVLLIQTLSNGDKSLISPQIEQQVIVLNKVIYQKEYQQLSDSIRDKAANTILPRITN